MIEFKDEILNGEPRYRLKDSQGNIVADNLIIEQITPVIQEGTPLNKGLFDEMDDRINKAKGVHSQVGGTLFNLIYGIGWDPYTDEEDIK